jgi:hypothetical protein
VLRLASSPSHRTGGRRAVVLSLLFPLLACAGSDVVATTTVPGGWLGFDAPVPYSSGGTGITSLAARDVTGDGRLDLIAVTRGESVHILAGSASGTFGAAAAFTAGIDPLREAAGDIDGDGVQDLVVSGHFDNAFHVRRGLGDGRFDVAVRYPLRNHGREIAVADLNGDGIDDVVAVHEGSGQPIWISVFLGSASGTMQRAWEVGTPYSSSKRVVVADFDGDGRRDVALAMGDPVSNVLFLRGTGTGQFDAPIALAPTPGAPGLTDGTESVAVADLDGNGIGDLVFAHSNPSRLSVRLSSTAGIDAPRLFGAAASIDIALGDVDGDGRVDAVASNLETGTLSVYPGESGGSFGTPRQFTADPVPGHLVVGDFDHDGWLDVAVASISDHQIRVLRNRGAAPSTGTAVERTR